MRRYCSLILLCCLCTAFCSALKPTDYIDFEAHEIDSIYVLLAPRHISYFGGIHREDFGELADLQTKAIYERDSIEEFVSIVTACEIDSILPYDSNEVKKNSKVIHTKKGVTGILWIPDDTLDIRAMVVLFRKEQHKVMWVSRFGQIEIGRYRLRPSKQIIDYLYNNR